jgi:sphingomyelin phosphodiesterase
MIYSPKDIDDQIQWLADTLFKAEKAGEKVHILVHVPTVSSCLKTWSREFRRITYRSVDQMVPFNKV